MSALMFQGIAIDVIHRDGLPWLQASQVSEALGYAREDAISRLYDRNKAEFSDGMTDIVKVATLSHSSETTSLTVSRNLQTEVRIFSARGCHLLAMLSKTQRAAAFRRWVLDVLEGLTLGADRGAALLSYLRHGTFFVHVDAHGVVNARPIESGARAVHESAIPDLLGDIQYGIKRETVIACLHACVKRLTGINTTGVTNGHA